MLDVFHSSKTFRQDVHKRYGHERFVSWRWGMLGHLDPRVLPITAYTGRLHQKGVPFRVRGWILRGGACLYIILLRLHQNLDKQRVRNRCIERSTSCHHF